MDDSRNDRPELERSPEHPPRKKRAPRKVSRSSLMNGALYHLERFACSRASLRQVLQRRAARSMKAHGGDPEEIETWIGDVLDTLEKKGFLNDKAFAESRTRSLNARGVGGRAIRMKLAAKGVDRDFVDSALERVAEEVGVETERELDLYAAVTYARRRWLGPWRAPEVRAERREKDLAALARQGFSYGIALRVVDADDILELEEEAGSF